MFNEVRQVRILGRVSSRIDLRPEPKTRQLTLRLILVLLLALGLGLAIFPDFGVTWDEPYVRRHGHQVVDFLTTGNRDYETDWTVRHHGPVMPVLFAVLERVSKNPEVNYPFGHLMIYLIFLAGVTAFYALCKIQFGDWRWGLTGAAFLFFSPRIFGHAFTNPKDAPFMSVFIIAMLCLIKFLDTRKFGWLIALAISSGVLIDIRIIGVIVPLLSWGTILADSIFKPRTSPPRLLAALALHFTILAVTILAFWPYLWRNPLGRFLTSFAVMSEYPLRGLVFYMGQRESTVGLPWHYLPVWIAITTPIWFLVLATIGLRVLSPRRLLTQFRTTSRMRFFLIYAAWLLVPPVGIVLLGSVLYNEWRHVLFIYPALLMFSMAGLKALMDSGNSERTRRVVPRFVVVVTVGVLGATAFRMVRLHPYENMYFNRLVGGTSGAYGEFETDYWGLSYKDGLEDLLRRVPGRVKLHVCAEPGRTNALLFEERNRIDFVELADAQFSMCTVYGPYLPQLPTFNSVKREGVDLLVTKQII